MVVSVAVGVVALVVMMVVAHSTVSLWRVIGTTSWARRRYGEVASPGAADRISKQELDLGIDASQFVGRPVFEFRIQLRINPQQVSLALAQ